MNQQQELEVSGLLRRIYRECGLAPETADLYAAQAVGECYRVIALMTEPLPSEIATGRRAFGKAEIAPRVLGGGSGGQFKLGREED